MNARFRLMGLFVIASSALHGCSKTSGDAPPATPVVPVPAVTTPQTTQPIVLASSADFGYLRSDSGPVSRIVQIRNSSTAVIHVSKWTVSCECLSVEPVSIDAEPEKLTYIRLVYDPSKEGEGFVGNLRMSVEGFADAERVCAFDVPVSVIAPADLKHLEK